MTKSLLPVLLLPCLIPGGAAAVEPVSFRQEVMPLLARAGCNQGTCHGNLNGKGGFKLSLRGQDADVDYLTLTHGFGGRRINRLQPAQSLILQKATTVVPHEGGLRFPPGSNEYALLLRWIAEGATFDPTPAAQPRQLIVEPIERILVAPERNVKVHAHVVFSDGARKNVSELAVFESTNPAIEVTPQGDVTASLPGETTIVVRYLHLQGTALLAFVPARADFRWADPKPANFIDEHVFARLHKLRMNPSDLCTDNEFLRRAYLDLLGLVPTPAETKQFLADTRPDKRARLVDGLLQRPEYADAWALKWGDLLRAEEKQLDRKGARVFYGWIRQAFADNKPLDHFARELIASRGSTYQVPAANYYRALRDTTTRSEAMAQVFLGIRMQCAKCHNHPFNQWTQDDYHQLAAFFARVQYRVVDNKRTDKLDKHEFIGDQVVFLDDKSEVKHPYTGAVMQPRFLGADTPALKPNGDRLLMIADWVTKADNPFFAKTQANRIWTYLFGQGIVEPNDDFRQSNPPTNGPLLDALTRDFIQHGFDQKHLIRTIMNSRTYQASARPNDTNTDDVSNFSHTLVRSVPAEALLDAIAQVTQTPLSFPGYPDVKRAGQLPSLPDLNRGQSYQGYFRFLKTFGKPERLLSCDCERSDATTLAQALLLITGDVVNKAVAARDNRLGKLLAGKHAEAEILDDLYLASLCRHPTPTERTALLARVEAGPRREVFEDILWGLLNSKEFLLRK